MANYIFGDIQGCFDELQCILQKIQFNPTHDTLWFVGDLVARGPKSLDTLRWIKAQGSAAKIVLGNHDLHLLAVFYGIHQAKANDKIQAILDASDAPELMDWLRHQALLLEHDDFLITHAGISPEWDLDTARQCARQIEAKLQSEHWIKLLKKMYGNSPTTWSCAKSKQEQIRYGINAFTRMRFCHTDGALDFSCKLSPEQALGEDLLPWFKVPSRKAIDKTIIFGHWAALNGYQNDFVIGLDTGCVWGDKLTALRWEDKRYFVQTALGTGEK